jgi:hypothetical protein
VVRSTLPSVKIADGQLDPRRSILDRAPDEKG